MLSPASLDLPSIQLDNGPPFTPIIMIAILKRLWSPLKAVLPAGILNIARFFYSPAYRIGLAARRTHDLVDQAWPPILKSTQAEVVTGPFRVMRYIHESAGSALCPKILGTYEKELHAVVEAIIASQPACIIDIGAAEGYYAVGFAMRLPDCRVVAFESDPRGQDLLRQLASLNGIADRIEIKGHCSLESLDACLHTNFERCVVICDAEGAEFELLDPIKIPKLAHVTQLVELHPWEHPHVSSVLQSRFQSSASCTVIRSLPRVPDDFPPSAGPSLSTAHRLASMNELRPSEMEWLWIEPK